MGGGRKEANTPCYFVMALIIVAHRGWLLESPLPSRHRFGCDVFPQPHASRAGSLVHRLELFVVVVLEAHIDGGLPFHGDGKIMRPVQSTEAAMPKKKASTRSASPKSKPKAEPESEIPEGFTLRHTLRGHQSEIFRIAWSRDGTRLASPSHDNSTRIWDADTGNLLQELAEGPECAWSVTWSPDGATLASGTSGSVSLWDAASGSRVEIKKSGPGARDVAWSPDEETLAFGTVDNTLELWTPDERKWRNLQSPPGQVRRIAWSPDGRSLACAFSDNTVRIWVVQASAIEMTRLAFDSTLYDVAWSPDGEVLAVAGNFHIVPICDPNTGRQTNLLEGHTDEVYSVSFSHDGRLLASKSLDGTVRLWRTDNWSCVAILPEFSSGYYPPSVAFHPSLPVVATLGEKDTVIRIWDLDFDLLLDKPKYSKHTDEGRGSFDIGVRPLAASTHYRNAKVALLGDTGVGKSGLALVLTGKPYEKTDSTPGRHVWTLEDKRVTKEKGGHERREALLWDLAGQPGYRLIHQLHLNEVTVAVVVFDARSETNPLSGVRHWDRAIKQARQRQGDSALPLKKYLVVGRSDRGGVAISQGRIDATMKEMGFDGFFETSAKEGWQVPELGEAIKNAIDWDALPRVTSEELLDTIKQFLLDEKSEGRLLSTADDLFRAFGKAHPQEDRDLRAKFEACVDRLQNRDLIRRLSFGGYVLLQPELLDAYASAMVNAARKEPDGFGSIVEEDAFAGRFRIPTDERVKDKDQERLLLLATVEELLVHEIALREHADDGRYLVFPSQFNRDWPDAPDPEGKTVAIRFEGPVQSVYATLAVRLAHSGQFELERGNMWRNAAIYTADVGGTCGIYLREFEEAGAEIAVFFKGASEHTRFQFEEYVVTHLKRRALRETIDISRSFICPKRECGTTVPDTYARGRIKQGLDWIECGVCSSRVSLADPKERLMTVYPSGVERIDEAADDRRDYATFLTSATGELETSDFAEWAGGSEATLAVVFTDVVGSTALGSDLGDERMNEVRRAHFTQTRSLLDEYNGREVKTLGDGFLSAFHTAPEAIDFALGIHLQPGHEKVAVRAGLHVGPVRVERGDTFGSTVNFAARVAFMAAGAEIWASDRAKEDIDQQKAERHAHLKWIAHDKCELKGFLKHHQLWSLDAATIPKKAESEPPDTGPDAILRRKIETGSYDVFLCHNSADKSAVRRIAEKLRDCGILPWLDESELRPGIRWQDALEEQIQHIESAAVFVGSEGIGPWQDMELKAFISEFVSRDCPVIPVVLDSCETVPKLPVFIRGFQLVDFRQSEPDPMKQLIWGITGDRELSADGA